VHATGGPAGCHHGAAGRLDFRRRFAHVDPGDSFDFLLQWFTGVFEQLAVKRMQLCCTLWSFGQNPLCGRQRSVQCNHQGVCTKNHGHREGHVARAFLLESDRRLRDLLCHSRFSFLGVIH
jgi:hypothetical protein